MSIDKTFYKNMLKKYLRMLYCFLEKELAENNYYYGDIDLFEVSFLYENIDNFFEEKDGKKGLVMEERSCKDCFYFDEKEVCLNVKSRFFMCRTNNKIVLRTVKDCFVEKNKEQE